MTEQDRKLALAAEASSVKIPYFVFGSVLVVIAILFAFTHLPKIQLHEAHKASKNIFHALRHRHLAWGKAVSNLKNLHLKYREGTIYVKKGNS